MKKTLVFILILMQILFFFGCDEGMSIENNVKRIFPYSVLLEDGTLWGCAYNEVERCTQLIKIDESVMDTSMGVLNIKEDGGLYIPQSFYDKSFLDKSLIEWGAPESKIMDDVLSVGSNTQMYYAIKKDYTLWAWGSTEYMEKTWGSSVIEGYPVKVMDKVRAAAITPFGFQVMVIKTDDSLWGRNIFGIYGTEVGHEKPVGLIRFMEEVSYADFACSGTNSYAIDAASRLWIFGGGFSAELIPGLDELQLSEFSWEDTRLLLDDSVLDVICRWQSVLYLKKDGTLWAIGKNGDGELCSNKSSFDKSTKVMDDVFKIGGDSSRTLLQKKDGTIWGFGSDFGGIMSGGCRVDLKN